MARKSHLYQYHKEYGKITEFSGFDMPLWYRGIIDEHMAVRNAAGLFDVSHMGRIWIRGQEATEFLSYVLPTNTASVKDGRAFYSTICNPEGGIVDDVITDKFSANQYLMVVNAGNREKDFAWLKKCAPGFVVELDDFSNNSALIAFQGPLAARILQKIANVDLSTVKRFTFKEAEIAGERSLVARTGYTGEDGFEITVFDTPVDTPDRALKVWNQILKLGENEGVLPCGLGARDSLRLEAGMCLYGQDIDEKISPVEADLAYVITQDKRDFVGKEILTKQLNSGTNRRRVAFSLLEPGIPRHGFSLAFSGKSVGTVTSGTFSPLLKIGIGMGYVPTPLTIPGQSISVDIRNSGKLAKVVTVPFYDTSKYGYKRKQ
ncbi:MAG TPA: glycine cleavage system aminomethyltransferase GcvT, partial [Nitrososphaerales archaeon]|nr:glycine cleavage system aminomethyltransferase GcvT [Nitrososphaerales archaeon]